MAITREQIGETAQGAPVEEYTLSSSAGVSVRVMTYGALLSSVRAPDRSGRVAEITLGFDDLAGYLGDHPYFGATVGRYANRIAQGSFELDGVRYRLATNDGPHHLHGGIRGFDKVIWSAAEEPNGSAAALRLAYSSVDGEEGYPGTLRASVRYSLTDAGELVIELEATTDKTTPVNLTNHAYWNLAGAGSGAILGHELTLNADHFLPVDETLIPTGEVRSVKGTPMDFTSTRTIGSGLDEIPGGGYDHCYVLHKEEGAESAVGRVRDPLSGRALSVRTTEPGVQLYTGNFLRGIRGREGAVFERHHGLCLETQHFPDSPNRPEFPSTLLEPGQVYRHTTRYAFSID